MEYNVKTKNSLWQHIIRFETWDKDKKYYIFYYENGDELIIKKKLVLYIKKIDV